MCRLDIWTDANPLIRQRWSLCGDSAHGEPCRNIRTRNLGDIRTTQDRSNPSGSQSFVEPIIIEREPAGRATHTSRPKRRSKKLKFGLKFANPFKSRKIVTRTVRQVSFPPPGGRQTGRRPDRERPSQRSGSSTESMSEAAPRREYVPLPPRIPTHHSHDEDPIIGFVGPRRHGTPEVHQDHRGSFDPFEPRPRRMPEPEITIARERDRRRDVERRLGEERERRRAAEAETRRVNQEAMRQQEFTERVGRLALDEHRGRRSAEEDARCAAARLQDEEDRRRRAEQAAEIERRERRLAERERAIVERQRQRERAERAEEESRHRGAAHIVQRAPPTPFDRGAEVIRRAQEANRQRRENGEYHYFGRDRSRDGSGRRRSLVIQDDDDERRGLRWS